MEVYDILTVNQKYKSFRKISETLKKMSMELESIDLAVFARHFAPNHIPKPSHIQPERSLVKYKIDTFS